MGVPYYCRRCEEMLTSGQSECPFCDNAATPVDELVEEASSELARLGMFSHARAVAMLAEKSA